jgi:hypothetical protein
MTRSHSRFRALSLALPVAALLVAGPSAGWVGRAVAQDAGKPKKDAALDDLLKELEEAKSDGPAAGAKPGTAKPAGDSKPASAKPAEKPKAAPAGGSKPAADVAPRDKALDSLLEKLGETPDKPTPDDHRGGGGGMPPPDAKKKEPRPGGGPRKPAAEELTGKSKDLDEHLEELTGRRKKKKGEGDEGSGPLSDVIKEMRDVEQRLGKTDTGEETRKKQQQIVKNLDTLIEQMRSASGQSQGKQKRQLAMKPGQQPGQNQPGQTPGTTGGNAPNTRPEKPTNRRSLAGGKDEWGHLPPELRQEMENVFREEFLPSREELIKRYYNAVARKAVKRGD